MPLRAIWIDMNSFFASVEQHDNPSLRGRPVFVAALDVDTTSCIAISVEAKQLGLHRGISVREARTIPNGKVLAARPQRYVQVHQQILAAIDTCIPVHRVASIDEVVCKLSPQQTEPAVADELGRRIKQAIYAQVGPTLRCSIGVAPNALLAKIASNMQKPDGLTLIQDHDLPHILHRLQLKDLPGIGSRMQRRLHGRGIGSVEQLCKAGKADLQKAWSGVVGERWWHWLRGDDLPENPTHRSTVGQSHVLPPELRTKAGAQAVLIRLIHKAAARLRRIGYWAGHLGVYISFSHREEGWSGSVALGCCQDTMTMIEAFEQLWQFRPNGISPKHVAVTLFGLTADGSTTQPLFAGQRRRVSLSKAMDRINGRFGRDVIYFAGMHGMRDAAPTCIAFSQIPDAVDFDPTLGQISGEKSLQMPILRVG